MPGNEDRSQVTKAMMHEQDTQSPARFLPCSHHGVSTAPEVTSSGSGLLWPKLSHPFGALGICHNLMHPFTHISSNTETPWRGITCLTQSRQPAVVLCQTSIRSQVFKSPAGCWRPWKVSCRPADWHTSTETQIFCLQGLFDLAGHKKLKLIRTAWRYSHNLIAHRNAPPKV